MDAQGWSSSRAWWAQREQISKAEGEESHGAGNHGYFLTPLSYADPPLFPSLQMSIFLLILATKATCAAQQQGFEKKGTV